MAVNASPLNQDDPNNPNNNVSGPAGSVSVNGVGATQGTGAPTSGGATAPPGGSHFVNLQRYLNANQGAGGQIAGAVAQKGEQQASNLQNTIGQQNTVIGGQLDAEKNRIAQASGMAQQVQQDPTKLTSDPNQLKSFQQLYSGQNAVGQIGQQAQQFGQQAQGQLQDVQNFANQAGTESGRFQLLKQTLGRPSYNQGQQKLDQLLVQSGGGNILNNLQQNLAQQATSGQNALAGSQQQFQAGIGDINAQTAAAQQQLQGAVGTLQNGGTGAFGTLQQGLNTALAQKQGAADTEYNAFQQRLANKQLTQDDVNKYLAPQLAPEGGFNANTSLFGLNPEDIQKSFSEQKYNLGNIASPEQVQRYKALQQLSGKPESEIISGLDESQIGKATGSNIQMDPNKLAEFKAKQADYMKDIAPYQQLAGQATVRQADLTKGLGDIDKQITDINNKYQGPENAEMKKQAISDLITNAQSNPNLASYTGLSPALQHAYEGGSEFGEEGDTDRLQHALSSYRNTADTTFAKGAQSAMDAINKKYGASGNVGDLMSPEAKAAFLAANPSYQQQLEADPTKLQNQTDYEANVRKLFGSPDQPTTPGGKTLAQLIGPAAAASLINPVAGVLASGNVMSNLGAAGDWVGKRLGI